MLSRGRDFRTKKHHSSNLPLWTLLYAIFLVGVLLYPYTFRFPYRVEVNNVKWLSQTNGVEFQNVSSIHSSSPINNLYDALFSGNGLTVEAWLASKDHQKKEFPRIISFSSDPGFCNFALVQQGRDLIVRLRTTKTDLYGRNPGSVIKNIFKSDDPVHIVLTNDFHLERIFVNGRLILQAPSPGGKFSNWEPSYPLVLGNVMTGERTWNGRLFLVAVYKRALSTDEVSKNYRAGKSFTSTEVTNDKRVMDELIALYLFNEGSGDIVRDKSGSGLAPDLLIPKELRLPRNNVYKTFLGNHFPLTLRDFKRDLIFNILAFVLFGFLLHRIVKRRFRPAIKTTIFVLIIGLLFLFTLESLQYFVEIRGSEIMDVISGTIGVGIGILVDKASSYIVIYS